MGGELPHTFNPYQRVGFRPQNAYSGNIENMRLHWKYPPEEVSRRGLTALGGIQDCLGGELESSLRRHEMSNGPMHYPCPINTYNPIQNNNPSAPIHRDSHVLGFTSSVRDFYTKSPSNSLIIYIYIYIYRRSSRECTF